MSNYLWVLYFNLPTSFGVLYKIAGSSHRLKSWHRMRDVRRASSNKTIGTEEALLLLKIQEQLNRGRLCPMDDCHICRREYSCFNWKTVQALRVFSRSRWARFNLLPSVGRWPWLLLLLFNLFEMLSTLLPPCRRWISTIGEHLNMYIF